MNVVLSVVYEKYTSNEKQKFEKLYKLKRRCVREAYKLLYNERHGGIIVHRFLGMMKKYYKRRDAKHSRLMFSAMSGDSSQVLSLSQFQHFYRISEFYFKRDIRKHDGVKIGTENTLLGKIQISIARLVLERAFRIFFGAIVVINCLLISINASYLTPEDKITPPPVDIAFLILYWLEALLMIIGLGWVTYWNGGWNKFDLSITVLSSFALAYSQNMLNGQFFAALRALRIVRIFKIKRRFRQVYSDGHISSFFHHSLKYNTPSTPTFLPPGAWSNVQPLAEAYEFCLHHCVCILLVRYNWNGHLWRTLQARR